MVFNLSGADNQVCLLMPHEQGDFIRVVAQSGIHCNPILIALLNRIAHAIKQPTRDMRIALMVNDMYVLKALQDFKSFVCAVIINHTYIGIFFCPGYDFLNRIRFIVCRYDN